MFCRADLLTPRNTVKIQGLKRQFEMKNFSGKMVGK